MNNTLPLVAALICGVSIFRQTDWRVVPWTLMFAFWILVWLVPRQKQGSIWHNVIPHNRK